MCNDYKQVCSYYTHFVKKAIFNIVSCQKGETWPV